MVGGAHYMEVTNVQLYLAIGIPMLFNAALLGVLVMYINARFDGSNESINRRFDAIDRRFDDMRDLWRAELRRVEGVLDARLAHLEER
jgi:hypothetical protein